jgi:hypothetical protein
VPSRQGFANLTAKHYETGDERQNEKSIARASYDAHSPQKPTKGTLNIRPDAPVAFTGTGTSVDDRKGLK